MRRGPVQGLLGGFKPAFVFHHHRLHAYRHALDMAVACNAICQKLPRGYGHIADQLRRSSSSVPLLVGEGANLRPSARKTQRYREALGECGESAVALELISALGLADTTHALDRCRECHRTLQRLTR